MRTSILLLLALLHFGAMAQDDSTRYLSLKEIQVQGKAKTQNQHLFNFFRGNMGNTLEDMMARLPELSFVRRGAYGMEPSVRALNGSQINLLIDGMRIYGACTDKMDPVTIYIEPANLDNIQVSTGADGNLRGSSLGGHVNLKMSEPSFSTHHTLLNVNTGYQSAANAFITSMRFGHHSGKFSFLSTATYRKAGDYTAGGGKTVEHSAYQKLNYSLSTKYDLPHGLYLKADLLGDDGWNIGYPALPMDVGCASARIAAVSIASRYAQGWKGKWQAKVYMNSIRHFMDDTQRPETAMHMDMPGISKTSGAFVESSWKTGNRHSLQGRADLSSTYQKASMTMYEPGTAPMYMLTWPNNRKMQAGVGLVWKYRPDSLWSITGSVRADIVRYRLASESAKQQAAIFGDITPRHYLLRDLAFGLERKLGPSLLGINIRSGNRAPSGSELYGSYLFNRQDNYDYIGNTALKAESALSAELSLTHNTPAAQLRVAAFANRIANYIFGMADPSLSTMTPGASGVKRYVNIPYANILGMEASAIIRISKGVQLVNTIKYNYGADDKKDPLPMISPWKNLSSLRTAVGKTYLQWECEAATPQHRFNAGYGEDATTGYAIFHLRFNYPISFKTSNAVVQCGVENIFDKYYHEHADWGNVPRMGRNVYLQLRWSLH